MTFNTFGFEAEFGTGVSALVSALYGEEACGMSEMHSWHCGCEKCDFDNGYLFRAQTDSSCDGEVITSIFSDGDWHTARYAMELLERLAFDVDAEPSTDAGCHVHVGVGHLDFDQKVEAFDNYLRWEPVLERVSAGRWRHNRGANQPVRYCSLNYCDTPYASHAENDRHSQLNVNTGHGTWEFRLWNSTRMAWRMELWVRLSLLFVNPDFVASCDEVDPGDEWDDTLLTVVGMHDEECHRLLDRQFTYLNERAAEAPQLLTA